MVLGDTAGLKFRYSHMIGDGQTHLIVGVYINTTHYQDCQELNPWKVEFVGEFYHMFFLIGNSLELRLAQSLKLRWKWLMFWGISTSRMFQVTITLLNGNPELLTLPPSSTVQDVRTKAQRSLWEKAPQTCHCQESSLSQFWANLRRSRDRGRRVPYSSGTSTATGSNRDSSRRCLCLVVSWR